MIQSKSGLGPVSSSGVNMNLLFYLLFHRPQVLLFLALVGFGWLYRRSIMLSEYLVGQGQKQWLCTHCVYIHVVFHGTSMELIQLISTTHDP